MVKKDTTVREPVTCKVCDLDISYVLHITYYLKHVPEIKVFVCYTCVVDLTKLLQCNA